MMFFQKFNLLSQYSINLIHFQGLIQKKKQKESDKGSSQSIYKEKK